MSKFELPEEIRKLAQGSEAERDVNAAADGAIAQCLSDAIKTVMHPNNEKIVQQFSEDFHEVRMKLHENMKKMTFVREHSNEGAVMRYLPIYLTAWLINNGIDMTFEDIYAERMRRRIKLMIGDMIREL